MTRLRSLSAILAFAAGFATMAAELSAVRLLAPSFGDSAPVWTNVIAVMLLALALGAWLGGRFADRGLAQHILPWAFGLAAAAFAAAPYLVPRVAALVLPDPLPLDLALGAMIRGSLAVGLTIFAPPVLLLGMVSPCLIKLACTSSAELGRASGTVYAFGTLGSLAGTFLATHVLVPGLGLRASFGLYAAVLLGCAVLIWFASPPRSRRAVAALVLPLFVAPTLFVDVPLPPWLVVASRDFGLGLVEARDSRYQRLWVLEGEEELPAVAAPAGSDEPDLPARTKRVRLLAINEGADSYHSVRIEGEPLTNGRYYDAFALLPAMLPEGATPRALSLGCATGALLRAIDYAAGGRLVAVGVELDPEVLALGREYFGTPDGESGRILVVGGIGARLYVERCAQEEQAFDLILLDAYRHQIYVPPQLASVEFFERARTLLRPGGLLAMNVGELPQGGPVLPRIAGTVAAVFPCVESLQLPRQRNALLIAHGGRPGDLARAVHRAQRPARMPLRLWEHAARDGTWRHWKALPEAERMTDDWSPLLRLHEQLYRGELADEPTGERG